jgi:hypothetical protein
MVGFIIMRFGENAQTFAEHKSKEVQKT